MEILGGELFSVGFCVDYECKKIKWVAMRKWIRLFVLKSGMERLGQPPPTKSKLQITTNKIPGPIVQPSLPLFQVNLH
jgi:hypothetical protein